MNSKHTQSTGNTTESFIHQLHIRKSAALRENTFKKVLPASRSAMTKEVFQAWLEECGENPRREGLLDTHERFIESRQHMFSGYKKNPEDEVVLFPADDYEGLVSVSDIPIFSWCEHHLLPFYGKAFLCYFPGNQVLGIGQFARIIDIFSRRMQTQEGLTQDIINFLENQLLPKGIALKIEAEHLCSKAYQSDKKPTAVKTQVFRGICKEDQQLHSQVLETWS